MCFGKVAVAWREYEYLRERSEKWLEVLGTIIKVESECD
jgi:hypothetical protein